MGDFIDVRPGSGVYDAAGEHPHGETVGEDMEVNHLGMWLFLSSEVLFFGALFTAYLVYRYLYPDAFAAASRELDLVLGTTNTVILLLSSFMMAMAVWAASLSKRRLLVFFLLATVVLGTVFLGIKGLEYSHKIEEGLYPARGMAVSESNQAEQPTRLFFSLYFIMTGLHALHMIIGVGMMLVLAVLSWRGRYHARQYAPVELAALYWHFVDIVWIFLFPLLYLIDRT